MYQICLADPYNLKMSLSTKHRENREGQQSRSKIAAIQKDKEHAEEKQTTDCRDRTITDGGQVGGSNIFFIKGLFSYLNSTPLCKCSAKN